MTFKNPKIGYASLIWKVMRTILATLLIAATATAQQPRLTEKIEVSVVNVDVTVTAPDGQPLRDLSSNDFEVFEDGRRQTITNFYAVEDSGPPLSGQPRAAVLHAAPQEPRFRRRVLVIVDVFHTTKNRRALALANLEHLVDESFHTGEYDWSVAILGRGVTVVLPLTSDKAAIHDAFDRMLKAGERRMPGLAADVAQNPSTPLPIAPERIPPLPTADKSIDARIDSAMMFEELNRIAAARFTTRAIIDAVRGFAGTSGKKIILLLTGDPGLNDLELTGDTFGQRDLYQRPLNSDFGNRAQQIANLRASIVREANASGVSLYIFNTEGLQPGGELGANPRPITNTSAAFWLAEETGGRLVTGNDGAAALRQFDAASSNYYSLGYRSAHGEDGKYHRIEVRLKNAKAKLEYRSGYSSSRSDTELARAMESPVAAAMLPNALPVTLIAGTAVADKGGMAVPISVKVPFASLQFLPDQNGSAARVRIYISVFDDIGKKLFSGSFPVGIRVANPTGTMVYNNAVLVNKGTSSRIVAAVWDETTEKVGVAEINLTPR